MAADGPEKESKPARFVSDRFLGLLVVLLTVSTAFSSYQGSLAGIEGDDLDFAGQKKMVQASSSFLAANSVFQEDLFNYDAYRESLGLNADDAALYLNRFSAALLVGLERPGDPFNELYEQALYRDANDLLAEVTSLEEQANLADEKASDYELSRLIFAIGLAAVAWASLIGTGRRLRLVFLMTALVAFLVGAAVLFQIIF